MIHRIFNASNILGAAAFLAMLASVAACEGGMYITSIALVAVFAGCASLSVKEDGKKKRAPCPARHLEPKKKIHVFIIRARKGKVNKIVFTASITEVSFFAR